MELKMKIAIGFDGRFVFLESFIETEENAGLKDLFEDLNYNSDGLDDYEAGVYTATLSLEHEEYKPHYDVITMLVIKKLEKL
jgi:hypothetical protein